MNNLLRSLYLMHFLCALVTPFVTSAQVCNPLAIDLPNNSTDEDCDGLDQLFLQMPQYSYAVEGKPFEIFFDNIMLTKNASKYQIEVQSPFMATKTTKYWRYTPTVTDAGEHPLTVRVRDANNNVIASASTTVRVSAQQTPTAVTPNKKFIFLGHSLVDQGVTPYYIRLMTKEQLGTTPMITFHGTRLSYSDNETMHEGKGGASWRFFLKDTASVLVDPLGKLDLTAYFDSVVCKGCKPDYLVIQLDVNDYGFVGILKGKILSEINDFIDADYIANVKPLLDAIRANAPNTKIGICMTPPANGRDNIMLNYFNTPPTNPPSVLSDLWRWKKVLHMTRLKYASNFSGREAENIFLIPAHLGVDEINQFNDDDPIHPYPSISGENGYHPISRSVYAWLKWQLPRTLPQACEVNGNVKNIKCDRNGTPSNAADDKLTFDLSVAGLNAGTQFVGNLVNPASPISGSIGSTLKFGPFPSNGSIYELNIASQATPTCKTKVFVSSAACSNGAIASADLSVTSTLSTPNPGPFTGYKATFTIKNNSSSPATEVFMSMPKVGNMVFSYPIPEPYTATQGNLDWSYSGLWDVGVIPANGSASITVDYYRLSVPSYCMYGQIYYALQEDPNSTPNNGNGISVIENDEVCVQVGVVANEEVDGSVDQLRVYPNPLTGTQLHVSMPSHAVSLTLSDVTGRTIQNWSGNSLPQNNLDLPAQLHSGTYFLVARTKQGSFTAKFTVVD
jgi:Secretion system C-terminal sorting domain